MVAYFMITLIYLKITNFMWPKISLKQIQVREFEFCWDLYLYRKRKFDMVIFSQFFVNNKNSCILREKTVLKMGEHWVKKQITDSEREDKME